MCEISRGVSSTRSVADGYRVEAVLRLSTSLDLYHVYIIRISTHATTYTCTIALKFCGDLKGYPPRRAQWTGYTGEAWLHFSPFP